MKILFSDKKRGIVKVLITNENDLWHLGNLIHKGDFVEARTFRAVKFGNKEERKPVFLKIEVESTKFSKLKKSLRITGVIVEGKPDEFVQKGKYHTIEIKEGDVITIEKEWMENELKRLKEAVEESKKPVGYIVLVEESKILVAKLLSYGIEKDEIEVYKSKRENAKWEEKELEFLNRLDKDVLIIVAGPGFAKLRIADYLKKKGYNVVVEEASYAEISGIVELIERGVLKNYVQEHRLEKEAKALGEFEKHLFKEDGYAVYGEEGVKKAIELGALEKLLILDSVLEEKRELVKEAEKIRAEIVIISSHSPFGKKVKGYGGILGILRFPIE